MLDAAETLDDLRVPPGNRLEALRGDRAGQHSIRINRLWRICFTWTSAGTRGRTWWRRCATTLGTFAATPRNRDDSDLRPATVKNTDEALRSFPGLVGSGRR